MSRSAFLARLGGVAGIFILIGWLWLAPSASERRFATLERLYQNGQLGQLEADDHSNFRSRIVAVTTAAGITAPLDIGSTPKRGHLHVYITDPSLAWFTNCSKGNAVYDSDLDAVFLDSTLWNPIELPKVGESWPFLQKDHIFGFSRTFIDFILLHELGHRQLHRSQWSLFDVVSTERGRQQEIEADAFAVNALQSGYSEGVLGSDESTIEELAEIGIPPNLGPQKRAVAALLYSTAEMSMGLLFSRGSFSSLFTDQSHPSFGQRVSHMGEVVSSISTGDSVLQPYFTYFERVAERVEQARQHHFVEVHMELPIEAAKFDEHGLTIIDTSWTMWHVDSAHLHDYRIPVVAQRVTQIPIADPRTYVASIWSSTNGEIFVKGMDGSLFQWNGKGIVTLTDSSKTQGGQSTFVPIPSVQPSTKTIRTDGSAFLVSGENRTIRSFRFSDILSSAKGSPFPYDVDLFQPTLVDGMLHVPVRKHLGPVAGCVEFEISNPEAARFVPLELDEHIDGFGEVVAVQDEKATRHFLAGKDSSKLSVWELFPSSPPALRASHATFVSELPDTASQLLRNQIEPYVTKAQFLPPGTIIMSLVGDSIYGFDVKSYELRVLFHPATNVNILLGKAGLFGFYSVNGYKAYVATEH